MSFRKRNPYYSGPVGDHFDGLRFFGPGERTDTRFTELLRWRARMGKAPPWPKSWPSPLRDRPPERVAGAEIRLSWIGHASFLLQTCGINLLLDPVWSERVSPVAFAGPRRVCAPGMAFEDLPPLDAVLVSHNHYDHMDAPTLRRLARERPAPVLTPLGNDAIVRSISPSSAARAFDWGDSVDVGPVKIHFTPAQHWSARGLGDRRMALWSAFVIETPTAKLYWIADTGFGDGEIFRALRRDFGPMDFAVLPIGAYEPRWFMKTMHVDPDEAVEIFKIVGARRAFGHHWGVFRLTDEPIDEPPKKLAQALERSGLDPRSFIAERPGAVAIFA